MVRPVATLRPVPPFPPVSLLLGPNTIGRGQGGVLDPRVSREQARCTVSDGDAGLSFALECLGTNPMSVCRGGVDSHLRKGDAAVPLAPGDSFHLLPKFHRFELVGDAGSAAASSAPKTSAAVEPPAAKRQHTGGQDGAGAAVAAGAGTAAGSAAASGSSSSGDSGAGSGGGGTSAPIAPGGGDDDDIGGAADWLGMELPPFVQPPKPAAMEGLGALERMALNPSLYPDRVLLLTSQLVVGYDVYPKARRHLLIMPRVALSGPAVLTEAHAPLLRRMSRLAGWLAERLRGADPSLPPLRAGFHAVPSMRQLHLHLISRDLDSACLKHKKHWNSFVTDFFVPPELWLAQLQADGRLAVDKHAQEAKLKAQMLCPASGKVLKDMPALKAHLASAEWKSFLASCAFTKMVHEV